jgi:hypothetical protein
MRTFLFLSILALCTFSYTGVLQAQQSQMLSVTPPLFQLTANPGDIWQSSVKVVNGNAYPMTVFAEVVNFEATGEVGQGKFVPVLQDIEGVSSGATLAEWIEIAEGPHVIPPERTQDISFFVDVPEDASPGGHYAAIMITADAPKATSEGPSVNTSQSVTSLFFVRIEGDVHEEGGIREFRVTEKLHEKPEAEFVLRFENKGNVHLLPRGEIRITNMWGTERGVIPVNYQTQFGNVLPKSIREFKFAWESEFSFTDIGRYKAIATLGYGEDGVKSVTATAYFWVIPVKATLVTLLVLVVFISMIVWMVKAYVRKMLALAGVEPEQSGASDMLSHTKTKASVPHVRPQYRHVSAPIKSGVLDLRTQLSAVDETKSTLTAIWSFVCMYKKFFISVCILAVIFVTTVLYIGKATEEHTRYNVTIEEDGVTTVIEGESLDSVGE